MPLTRHVERHFTSGETVRDIVKGHFTGAGPIRSALQTALVGGLGAAAAFGMARAIS